MTVSKTIQTILTGAIISIAFALLAPNTYAAIPINAVTSSALKTDSATISWDSTSAGTSTIEYGTTTSYGFSTTEDSLAYFHVQNITGLSAGTLYHYRIHTKDYNGAETISTDYTFTTRTQTQLDAVIKAARTDGQLPKTYYVSPTGNDANNGLSTTTAWRTLAYASGKLDVGDTVYLMSGTYLNDIFTFAKGGIDVAPITLTKYPGATPVLDGSGLGGSSSQVYSAYNYVIIDSLEVRRGIYGIITDGSNSVISNNNIHDTRSHCALLGNPRDSAINNTMNNCGDAAHTDNGLQILSGYATVKGNALSNVLYHNTIDMMGTFSYVTIDNNTFSTNQDQYIANPHDPVDTQKYITIKNNVFNDKTSYNAAIVLTDATSEALIYNNTFNNIRPPNTVAVTIEGTSRNVIFLKNRLYNSKSIQPLVGSGYYFLDNFVNSDSDSIVLGGVSGTFGYIDGTVFNLSYSGCSVTSALQHSQTGSAIGLSGTCSMVPTTYAMTATLSAGSATVSVTSFNTSLPLGSILANFTSNSTNGTNVIYTMSTLKQGTNYLIKKGGTSYTTVQADSTGKITFSNSVWPSSNFTVEETAGGTPIVSDPTFSPVSGTYSSTQSVTISSATTGATIYYNTDNSTPTTSSSIYSSPVTVFSTTTIKALAVKSGLTNSLVVTGTYTIAIPVLTSITVSPSVASISTGSTQTFTATPKDQFNNPMTGVTISWASSNTSVATINSSGLATGVAVGTSTVTASSGGISGTASLAVANQPSGLIAYWKFDENTGAIAYDSSTSLNTGTLTNSPVWTTGKVNNALSFNGTNSYVGTSKTVNIPQTTIEAWINIASTPNGNKLITGFANGLNSGIEDKYLYVTSTSQLAFTVWDGVSDKTVSSSANQIPLNAWTYVSATADGTNAKIYINGVQAGSVSAGNTETDYTVPNIFIGGSTNTAKYFNGKIDEVRIYNRALSLSEIQTDMNSGTPTISSADLNSDGVVNSVDFGILMSFWNSTSKPKADINQDGIVNSVDFGIMMSGWG